MRGLLIYLGDSGAPHNLSDHRNRFHVRIRQLERLRNPCVTHVHFLLHLERSEAKLSPLHIRYNGMARGPAASDSLRKSADSARRHP